MKSSTYYVEQANSKDLNILPLYNRPYLEYSSQGYAKNKLGSQFFYSSLVYKFNVCFIRLENLVCQNNPFIIYTIGQLSIQRTTFNQPNITKQIFLNITFHQH